MHAPFPVLLTFDDGWSDAVRVGGPLLEQQGCQAVMFISTDFLDRRYFLSRAELARVNPNVFRVGSHARSHRMLSLLGAAEVRAELMDSKKVLEDIVGYEVDALSIPNGAVDRRVRGIAVECGYRFVCDSEVRINRHCGNPTAIGRVAIVSSTSLPEFRKYVQQRLAGPWLRRAAFYGPKRVLGLRRYAKLRRRLLG
jgi:peptidoglycan/xylan/chitin deacetylase (PgdA/CDA1 family)